MVRITIRCDPVTKRPLVYGFMDSNDTTSVEAALALDETLLRPGPTSVRPKRKNYPGMSSSSQGHCRGRSLNSTRERGYFRAKRMQISAFAANYRTASNCLATQLSSNNNDYKTPAILGQQLKIHTQK